ncbi:hypothetical protein [Thermoflexibacter ruber]|uniref:Lipocalin-like domain-containing protein n=1 Tax=Thermoflexibacter ruber TaxID=1003 RepID=A0A1I2GH05_9BACT|nr:hypothetical protein [Thermoflexibacter ruber]SFF16483.1 hypothetical protein SAMN04488541_101858 [Thermoflexibacter ruber]
MNKIIPFLLFLIITAQACTPEKVATTLASILTQGSGKWKVTFAKFGDEEPPRGMYDRFLIEFRGGDVYVTTNPDGAISPATLPRGTWKESNGKITFDGTVVVREITQQRTSNKIVLEWEVSIPGKVTTTYRIELMKAN